MMRANVDSCVLISLYIQRRPKGTVGLVRMRGEINGIQNQNQTNYLPVVKFTMSLYMLTKGTSGI